METLQKKDQVIEKLTNLLANRDNELKVHLSQKSTGKHFWMIQSSRDVLPQLNLENACSNNIEGIVSKFYF